MADGLDVIVRQFAQDEIVNFQNRKKTGHSYRLHKSREMREYSNNIIDYTLFAPRERRFLNEIPLCLGENT
jgi:hypothetical protein